MGVSTQSTWGESSAPRRPTHDTHTSRRQVNTHTSTTSTTTTLQQIQTHYEDYWSDCIYFDASSCCYGFNSFCKGHHCLLQSLQCKLYVMQSRSIGRGVLQEIPYLFRMLSSDYSDSSLLQRL